jgi:hypothetical protein
VLTPLNVAIGTSLSTLVVTAVFLLAVVIGVVRRRGGRPTGPRQAAVVTLLGGLTLGMLLLVGSFDLVVAAPLLVAAAILGGLLWRRGRRAQAGWILAGVALPWTILWAIYLGAMLLGINEFAPESVWLGFALGMIPTLVGLAIVARGDPAPPAPTPEAPAGAPGSRAFGTISEAIREPGFVGPIGVSELAALVGVVVGWGAVPLLLPPSLPRLVAFAITIVAGSVLGTEAYIRAMPGRSRRAFEAFSWLGEWELRRLGLSPFRIPTTRAAAVRWLTAHPEIPTDPGLIGYHAELLTLAGRYDEARALAAQMPSETAQQRWERAEALDSVDWRAGGEGDLAGMEAAAAELRPLDGDERLRAEVSIATAKVRRRMADGRATPGDAVEPLLEVRVRLGKRADGQVGRALRRRLLTVFLVSGFILGGLAELVFPLGTLAT